MDRRQLLIGSGATAIAGSMCWTPEVARAEGGGDMPPAPMSPLDGGVRGSFAFNAGSIALNGIIVPAV